MFISCICSSSNDKAMNKCIGRSYSISWVADEGKLCMELNCGYWSLIQTWLHPPIGFLSFPVIILVLILLTEGLRNNLCPTPGLVLQDCMTLLVLMFFGPTPAPTAPWDAPWESWAVLLILICPRDLKFLALYDIATYPISVWGSRGSERFSNLYPWANDRIGSQIQADLSMHTLTTTLCFLLCSWNCSPLLVLRPDCTSETTGGLSRIQIPGSVAANPNQCAKLKVRFIYCFIQQILVECFLYSRYILDI